MCTGRISRTALTTFSRQPRRSVRDLLAELAKKLRARADWCTDGWYTRPEESTKNAAMRETFEAIASDIEELLLPEPKEP